MTMRALVADGNGGLLLDDAPRPALAAGHVVVEVRFSSLNRGELTRAAAAPAGWRPGWDFTGVIAESTDPAKPAGTPVVGIAQEAAWAQFVSVPAGWVAALDPDADFARIAALPVAGLTALRMLRLQPGTLGRTVLVTGASGGVGRLAVQLARLGGAEVTALASPESAATLHALGAHHVVDEIDGTYDLVLESVGGETLAAAAEALELDGTLVMFGNSSNQPTTFSDIRDVYLGGARRLQSFTIFHTLWSDPPARDLCTLATFVEHASLDPGVQMQFDWAQIDVALARLESRTARGKIALSIGA
jgi:NADPH:quinone reductase-like Zn-dependent oxidoreductase